MIFVYFLKIILTFKKIKYLYIKDLQKSWTKTFATKHVLIKQLSVFDRELNSTSINGLCLLPKTPFNLQKIKYLYIRDLERLDTKSIYSARCFGETNKYS